MGDQFSDHELRTAFNQLGFFTCGKAMIPLLGKARKAAQVSDITVLLEGETGTGKQILARGIHALDEKRNRSAFITVHCSTISEALAESELFGHQRGAFSGAFADRKGLFQAAHRGTLFLDDINDLPYHLQPKLLDVIQRGTVRPVGCDRETRVDVRIIAASNQKLEPLVREGRFRSDLYHRLNVVRLALPPLRERGADVPTLIRAFTDRYRELYGPITELEPELLTLLDSWPFIGNVRELENAVQRMLFLKQQGSSLGLADWEAQLGSDGVAGDPDLLGDAARAAWKAISQCGIPYAKAFEEIEKKVLQAALTGGSTRREVAEHLHTSERTLYYKMRTHGLRNAAS